MVLLWYVSDLALAAAAVANEAAETQVPSEDILEAVEHKEAAMTFCADEMCMVSALMSEL